MTGRTIGWVALLSWAAASWAGQPLGCLIEPQQVADVGSQVVGLIEAVHVERGDVVRKGQKLATLRADIERAAVGVARSKADADADVQAAGANREFARQRLLRAEDLFDRKFISQQALDQARTDADVAEQKHAQAREQQRILQRELELAHAQLSQRVIRSPIDGVVAERFLSTGERIEEKPLARIAKVDPLKVEVIVPSSFYGRIAAGALAEVRPELPGAAPLQARITLVDKVMDAASNTFRVQLELPNPDLTLPAGLRCKADFGLEPKAAARPPAARAAAAPSVRPAGLRLEQGLATPPAAGAPLLKKSY